MRRAWLAILVATLTVLGSLAASPHQALAQAGSELIRTITVEGNERIETATVESYLTVRPGEVATPEAIDQSLKNLFATGLFDDVQITREGERLLVRIVENPIINQIAFEGNRKLDDKTLEAEIQLRPRVVYTKARVQNAVNRILELYRRSGRFGASVEPKIIELDQNRVDLVFEIDEGPVTRVGGITFIGNETYSDSTLRGVIQTKESAWYRFLSNDDAYDPDRVNFDQELLRRFYLARGYAEFSVVSAVAELTPDGQDFFITFTIDEGPRFDFGSVTIESQLKDLSVEELTPLLEAREGNTFNADEVEATVQALTDRTGELGYAFAQVEPRTQINREALTVDVVFQIQQGPRVYVERIDIRGNVRTLDSVIRREFRLAEGDAFNTVLLRRSEQRIRNLGYFETVELRTQQGSAPDKVVIDLRVTEKSTGELSFGAGFSTSDGVLGDVRLTERNLLGRGQTITANFTLSQRRQEIDFAFTEPYFLGYDLAAGVDLFWRETDFQSEASYNEMSRGGTLRASYPLTEFWRHSVRYTLRQDDIQDVDDDASVFIKEEAGERWTSLVGQTFTYDRRDTRFLPSEGYLFQIDQDVAGLGGDNRFVRHDARSEYYYSIRKDWVVNLGASAGYIHGIGGEEVHLDNRFFLGGPRLHGFSTAGVGPRDRDTGDALGGNLYYLGNVGLRFPLGLPEELRIFGRTFVDAGTLYEIDVSGPTLVDDDKLRVGAGIGLSWLSPLGPLSVDISQALLKNEYDKTEMFRVSFGTRF
ncbi:MAG: outer membrane protein assembly factor BamA [Geminicoccaceae bacterium]